MKNLVLFSVVAALAGAALPSASAQQLHIGTVDMKKVFENYYKTKDAEQRINEARNTAKKELEDRSEDYKKAVDEVRKLNDDIQRPELSKQAKDDKSKDRDDRVTKLRTMEREIQEFQSTREKQLQEQSVRMRSGIVDEITKVVNDRVKADQYDLVLDRSGPSLNGVPVVLYAKDSYDFTTDVVTALNKTKSASTETSASGAPAAPAATPKPRRP